jgi:hypothetical protein
VISRRGDGLGESVLGILRLLPGELVGSGVGDRGALSIENAPENLRFPGALELALPF